MKSGIIFVGNGKVKRLLSVSLGLHVLLPKLESICFTKADDLSAGDAPNLVFFYIGNNTPSRLSLKVLEPFFERGSIYFYG